MGYLTNIPSAKSFIYTFVDTISVGTTIMEETLATGQQKATDRDFTTEDYTAMIDSFTPVLTADVVIIRIYNAIHNCASLDLPLKALLTLYLENLSLDQTIRRDTVVNTNILYLPDSHTLLPNDNEDQDMLELEHRFSHIKVGRRPEAQRRSQNMTKIKALQLSHPGLERKATVYVRARLSAFMEAKTGLITKTRIPGLLSRLYDFEDRQSQSDDGRSFAEQLRQGFCEIDLSVIARSTKTHAVRGRLAKVRTVVRDGRARANRGKAKGNPKPPESKTRSKADGMDIELSPGMRLNKNGKIVKIVKVESKTDEQRARRRGASKRRKARALRGEDGEESDGPTVRSAC